MGNNTREREGELVELVGDQNSGPEAPCRSRKGREREQRKCQERSDGEGGGYVRVIKGEIRRDDPVKYYLPWGTEVPLESQRG